MIPFMVCLIRGIKCIPSAYQASPLSVRVRCRLIPYAKAPPFPFSFCYSGSMNLRRNGGTEGGFLFASLLGQPADELGDLVSHADKLGDELLGGDAGDPRYDGGDL